MTDPTTNVPAPTLTDTGFVPPTEQAILAGRQLDFNFAFGTTLNFGTVTNPTPQGQLTASETAIIGNVNAMFCLLANMIDPAFAFGRFQDALARVYFLTRNPGESTVIQVTCIGEANTVIPFDALIGDAVGNQYWTTGGTIPVGGTIVLPFYNQIPGPTPALANTVKQILQVIQGWDSVNNPADGVLGAYVETRSAFETRRRESIAGNSMGMAPSVLGAIEHVTGVTDAYVTDNYNNYDIASGAAAQIMGSIAATTLHVETIVRGEVKIGQVVTGAPGTGSLVLHDTVITADLGGGDWTVSHSQAVSGGTPMNLGGVTIPPNCLYVATIGGDAQEIANAIWTKKGPGCSYYPGNTTRTVYDTSPIYLPPGIPYIITWEIPPVLPFVFDVRLVQNPGIPSDADTQIKAAIIDAFSGSTQGVPRARIGQTVLASRFIPPIAALGLWAQIASVLMGTKSYASATFTGSVGAIFTGVAAGTNLTVTGIAGKIRIGDTLHGTGVGAGITIASQTSGTTGGNGVYVTSFTTTANGVCTVSSAFLFVSAVDDGTVAVGQYVFDDTNTIDPGVKITTDNGGGFFTLSAPFPYVLPQTMYGVVANQTVIDVNIAQAPTTANNLITVESMANL